jgi:ketosteroid isomerase-like protein
VDLGRLRVNQLSSAGWSWYQDYLDALDAYDLDRYTAFLAPDVAVQFNNDAPMRGRDTAAAGLAQFWGAVSGLGWSLLHEPLNIYGDDRTFVLEALNHYDQPGRNRITVRAAAFTDRGDDGTATSVRLYQDVSALFAPPPAT